MARKKLTLLEKLQNHLVRTEWYPESVSEEFIDICGYKVEVEDGRYCIYHGETFYSAADPRSITNWIDKQI